MYYPFFLAYILTGVSIAAVVFIWALKTGQFSEQQRARYLPLEQTDTKAPEPTLAGRLALFVVFGLAVSAVAGSAVLIGYALFFNRG